MIVPKLSQLRKGVGVKIVLKADQRTGKLTTGSISDILTRGDHPRGIKVRLTDGQIGRVQSLTAPPQDMASVQGAAPDAVDVETEQGISDHRNSRHPRAGHGGREERGLQDNHRLDQAPPESLSLFDYIRMPSSTAKKSTSETAEIITQKQLESEFPKLDSALISAILFDYPEAAKARTVLSSLS